MTGEDRHDPPRTSFCCHRTTLPDRTPADYKAEPDVNQYMMERLKVDLRGPAPAAANRHPPAGAALRRPALQNVLEDGVFEDYWGIRSKHLKADHGSYDMHVHTPLWDAKSVEDLEKHDWPTPDIFDYSVMREQCARYRGLRRDVRGGRPVHAAVHPAQHGERDARHGRAAGDGALPVRQVHQLLLRGHPPGAGGDQRRL